MSRTELMRTLPSTALAAVIAGCALDVCIAAGVFGSGSVMALVALGLLIVGLAGHLIHLYVTQIASGAHRQQAGSLRGRRLRAALHGETLPNHSPFGLGCAVLGVLLILAGVALPMLALSGVIGSGGALDGLSTPTLILGLSVLFWSQFSRGDGGARATPTTRFSPAPHR